MGRSLHVKNLPDPTLLRFHPNWRWPGVCHQGQLKDTGVLELAGAEGCGLKVGQAGPGAGQCAGER
jgi:hypothetical protein